MTPEQFRKYRTALGLTQKEMAVALGLSANHLARLERGERPILTRTVVAMRLLFQYEIDRRKLAGLFTRRSGGLD
jgi:transcriptional regulator with XRE-family HTH domain